jgi:hypothetical protein
MALGTANRTGGLGATTHDRPQSNVSVAAAVTGGREEHGKRPQQQGSDSGSCHVHPMLAIAPRSAKRS